MPSFLSKISEAMQKNPEHAAQSPGRTLRPWREYLLPIREALQLEGADRLELLALEAYSGVALMR